MMRQQSESRQQPGFACEECRKKKLRCDRQRPHCAACALTGVPCRPISQRRARRSKKDDMATLRRRIEELESHLPQQQLSQPPASPGGGLDLDLVPEQYEFGALDWGMMLGTASPDTSSASASGVLRGPSLGTPSTAASSATPPTPLPSQASSDPNIDTCDIIEPIEMSDVVKADLTELYFDRVHLFAPILSRARISRLMRAPAGSLSRPQECLQYTLWTMAMAFSSQFGHSCNAMYAKTRAALEDLDARMCDSDGAARALSCTVEQVQAWLLLAHYECVKLSYQRSWLTSGHAVRLMYLVNLHQLDRSPPPHGGLSSEAPAKEPDPVRLEEKRRTFWLAFSLDRVHSIVNHTPLTIPEDSEFVAGLITPGPFLADVFASTAWDLHSPFAESILAITIGSHVVAHRAALDRSDNVCGPSKAQARSKDAAVHYYEMDEPALRNRAWLECLITNRIQSLNLNHPTALFAGDPLVVYAHLAMRSTVILLGDGPPPLSHVSSNEARGAEQQQQQQLVPSSRQQHPHPGSGDYNGIAAAHEIVRIVYMIGTVGYFKTHPFSTYVFCVGIEQLLDHIRQCKTTAAAPSTAATAAIREAEAGIQTCLRTIQRLAQVNKLADDCWQLLRTDASVAQYLEVLAANSP